MKYHCRFAFWSLVRPLIFLGTLAVVAGPAPAATAPSDEGVPVDIDVRSTIDPKWEGFHKLATVTHGKLYLLASVNEVPSAEKIVRPVDKGALATALRREMASQGFREITAEEKPEVVLTVSYGRGFLRNPYLDDAQVDEATPGAPVSTITLAKQTMRQREFGYEAKLQKAQMEKLYISVTAWQYPANKAEKPNQLWRTVMVVDNPDHRDLNLAMPAMLAAGVVYFDRNIKDVEVTVNSTMPRGSVKLGPLEVINEKTGK